MSKYIIELDDRIKLVTSVGVTENGVVYATSDYAHNLEELNSDYVNEHYGSLQDEAYQRGLEVGKAQSERGCDGCRFDGTRCTACENCCNSHMNHWTAKDDEINVGDVVEWDGTPLIVTRIFKPYNQKEQCDGIDEDGSVYDALLTESLTKTGRHFDIGDLLKGVNWT